MPVISPTTAFTDALRYGSQLVSVQFTIYSGGAPTGTVYDANASTGSITVDRNANQRRSGQITIELDVQVPPVALMPISPTSILAPFGNEIFIQTGVAQSGNLAGIQWVPSGLFAIATSAADDTTIDCTVTLDIYDRSWTIAQRALLNPYNFPQVGGNFVAEIQNLLNMVWGEQTGVQPLQYNILPTNAQVPVASYNQGEDPWQAALDMASAVGYELYFDTAGTVVGKPIPVPSTQPITWNFTDDATIIQGIGGTGSAALFGSAYSTPVDVSVEMTRDGIYNDIVIQGTGDANMATFVSGFEVAPPPALGLAADTNPQSPTYIGGGMGNVPNFVSTSLIASNGAQAMANNQLQVALSSSWTATVTASPNPIFDVDDVVAVTRPRVGLNGATMVLDTITHAFRYADTMAVTGRIITFPVAA